MSYPTEPGPDDRPTPPYQHPYQPHAPYHPPAPSPTQPYPTQPYPTQQQYGPPPQQYGPPQPQYGPPQYTQPGYPPPYGQPEYLSQGGYGDTSVLGPPIPGPAPKRRHTVAIVVGLAIALVLSGGAIAGAFVWYGWGATEPEDVLPGSSLVFARADLSPGLGQQIKLGDLLKKFPQRKSGRDAVDEFKQNIVSDVLKPLQFDADIAPWLGDRLGVSLWMPDGKAECTLIALASNDDGKASAALERAKDVTFAMSHGYAVLAHCEGSKNYDAQAAVAAADQQSLSENATFAASYGHLPSGQAVVGWLDGGFINRMGSGSSSSASTDLKNISVLVGVRATSDGVETRVRVHNTNGQATTANSVNAVTQLDKLPRSTVVGVSADLTAAKGASGVLRQTIGDLPNALGAGSTDAKASFDKLSQLADSVLGSVVSVSMVNPQDPQLRILVEAADGGSAQDVADALHELLDVPNNAMSVNGKTVSVQSEKYNGGSGTLSDDSRYRTAMADPPENTVLAAYVDLADLYPTMELDGEAAEYVKPLKAVGLALGTQDNDTELLLRVVVQ